MFAVAFTFVISMLLIAGSTQIENGWLSAAQFIAGIWFAIAGAITGWREANK